MIVDGTAVACVTGVEGKGVTFMIAADATAHDLADRAWHITADVKRFVFDQPRVHLAVLLTGLARSAAADPATPTVQIEQRPSQELIAEMLGITRQWASTLIRDMVAQGLLEWRCERVTLLNFAGLCAIAVQGVNARHAPKQRRR